MTDLQKLFNAICVTFFPLSIGLALIEWDSWALLAPLVFSLVLAYGFMEINFSTKKGDK